jgi:hypothetical protein
VAVTESKLQHYDIMPFAIAKPRCLAFEKQTVDELAKYLKPAIPGEEVDCRGVSPGNLCSQTPKPYQSPHFSATFHPFLSPFTLLTCIITSFTGGTGLGSEIGEALVFRHIFAPAVDRYRGQLLLSQTSISFYAPSHRNITTLTSHILPSCTPLPRNTRSLPTHPLNSPTRLN